MTENTNEQVASWTKTNIFNLQTMDQLPFFSFIKIFAVVLLHAWLILSLSANAYTHHSYSLPPQRAMALGTTIALVFSILVTSSLHKQHISPETSGRREFPITTLKRAFLSRKKLPKGIDTMLAAGFGVFGLLLLLFLLAINQENSSLAQTLEFLSMYSMVFYTLMTSFFIFINDHALLSFILLGALLLIPSQILDSSVMSSLMRDLIFYWTPILVAYFILWISKKNSEKMIDFSI